MIILATISYFISIALIYMCLFLLTSRSPFRQILKKSIFILVHFVLFNQNNFWRCVTLTNTVISSIENFELLILFEKKLHFS